MSYAKMDHAAWAESNNRAANSIDKRRKGYKPKPETLSPFQAIVMDICGMVGGGIYNAPINWDRVEWGRGIEGDFQFMVVPWRDGRMATFDGNALTLLVLLCHEARIRCDVRAKANGHFELLFHKRADQGSFAQRHPSIDEAVTAFWQYLPADHRIRFQPGAESVAA